jgi:Fe-S cluster assembly protein SufD
MTVMARRLSASGDVFQDDFARHSPEFPGAALDWLNARRRAAIDAFAITGIPGRRSEAWKWTDLANLLDFGSLAPAGFRQPAPQQSVFPKQENDLAFSGGFLTQASVQPGIDVIDLSKLVADVAEWVRDSLGTLAHGPDQPMGAASLALMRSGVAIRVRNDTSLQLGFFDTPSARPHVSHSRVLLIVESGVSLRLVESHCGAGAQGSLQNLGFELHLKPQARVEHIRVQKGAADAVHLTSLGAAIERDASYRGLYAALGGQLSRIDVNLRLGGVNSEAVIHHVAALARGIADITSVVDHASPHTCSRQLFKNVVGGKGRTVNQGRVIVRHGAIKSDSHQLFKSLLLSPHAEADAKPELEIFADDVLCGHGTAIGALEEDALFYLRSRGIPEPEAKLLLIRGFVAEAMEEFGDDGIRHALWRELDAGLASAESGQ